MLVSLERSGFFWKFVERSTTITLYETSGNISGSSAAPINGAVAVNSSQSLLFNLMSSSESELEPIPSQKALTINEQIHQGLYLF
ncbi:hypothetical protein TNCV_120371 [Trichonephila clavipes]|nr:hypothetical protein TNCV_120371 [Trichonephila clavipes]